MRTKSQAAESKTQPTEKPTAQPPTAETVVGRAHHLAENVLWPTATVTDQSGVVPLANLDAIADAGLYGLAAPHELGGVGADQQTLHDVIEVFAGACLTTCFVWLQHQGAARAAAATTGPANAQWGSLLATGQARGGVAFAHLLRAGPPAIVATPSDDGWKFSGQAPWVTGWGYIDVVHVGARHGDDIVWALIPTRSGVPQNKASIHSTPLRLAAIDSSATASVALTDHPVSGQEVTFVEPYDQLLAGYPQGLRLNGSLALGVAGRALTLLDRQDQHDELAEAKHLLDTASIVEMSTARARVSALAVRITTQVIASLGGRAITLDHPAQRLAREALFLLVQGQTQAIRTEQRQFL